MRYSEETGGYQMRYLTETENNQIKSASARARFDLAYRALPPTSEFIAAALAGAAKRGWYVNARRAIESQYGADAPRFTALLAALSPRVSLQTNVKNAIAVFEQWDNRGRPSTKAGIVWNVLRVAIDGELLGAWIPNAVTSLSVDSAVLSGPKVDSFQKNLRGDLSAVTCDAWMCTFAGTDQMRMKGWKTAKGYSKSIPYLALSARVRAAAKLLGWQPAEVQECIWAFTKTAYETASAQGTTVRALVQAGAITDAIIGATPDIHTLFACVGTSLGIASAVPKSGALLRIAKRLDAKLAAARDANEEPNF
jgi:hypothetical protein